MKCTNIDQFVDGLFQQRDTLVDIQFPPLLKSIGKKCFYNCTKLKAIILPNLISTINSSAFANCESLQTVVYCGLDQITSPNDVFQGSLVKIIVTQNYHENTLCSMPVIQKLSNNCFIPNPFFNTCKDQESKPSVSLFSILLIVLKHK